MLAHANCGPTLSLREIPAERRSSLVRRMLVCTRGEALEATEVTGHRQGFRRSGFTSVEEENCVR